jgi:hypothetical protein
MIQLQTLKEIYEGWKKLIWENKKVEAIAKRRIETCVECLHFNHKSKRCEICTCYMPAGVRSPEKKCPKGKW